MTLLEFLGLCVFPSSDTRRNILHKFTEIAIWNRHVGVPPRYAYIAAGKYCKHLRLTLARRLIICTEQTSIYINTFPNTLTSKWAKNHEISI